MRPVPPCHDITGVLHSSSAQKSSGARILYVSFIKSWKIDILLRYLTRMRSRKRNVCGQFILTHQVISRSCGGHCGLAHPRWPDSLLSISHLLNTETDSRVKWLLEKFSQCVCDAEWVQQASGRQYTVCTRRSGAWVWVCIVCRDLHTNHNHSRNHIDDPDD